MYGGEVLDDSAHGPSDGGDEKSSDSSLSESELENYLYSQIHYLSDDNEKSSSASDHCAVKENDDAIVISDSEQSKPATPKVNVAPARFVERTVSCSSLSNDESIDAPVQLQFNTGASLLMSVSGNHLNHPLMSVRQQYSRYNNYSAKKRYFDDGKDAKLGKASSLIALCGENGESNTEFYCYLCGETSHLSKMCHLRLNNQRSRRNFNDSSNEQEVCSTCGRKDHHSRSWLIRGPPRLVCPNLRCSSCGDPGHKLTECSDYENIHGRVCRRCGIPGHLEAACPDLWRMFHATVERNGDSGEAATATVTINDRRFCYVCGRRGHFGFECLWESRPTTARFLKSPFISTYTKTQEQEENELAVCEESGNKNDPVFVEDEKRGRDFRNDECCYIKQRRIDNFNQQSRHSKANANDYSCYKSKDEIMRENRRKWHGGRDFGDNRRQVDRHFRDQRNNRQPTAAKARELLRRKITFA